MHQPAPIIPLTAGVALSVADVQEKIIGENTLRHLYELELALEVAKSVVHLRVTSADGKASLGTGFMLAPDLLMTNHHVIATTTEAETATYSFNYQLDRKRQLCNPISASALFELSKARALRKFESLSRRLL